MNLLLFLLFGLVVGVVARLIVPGRQPGGFLASIVIGILGSFAGGYLAGLPQSGGEVRPAGFLMSVLGAVILLFLYHLITKGRRAY